MNPKKELQKRTTKQLQTTNLKLSIYSLISEGRSPAAISHELSLRISTLQYHLNYLRRIKAIEKIGYGTWIPTEKYKNIKELQTFLNRVEVEKPTTNLHALQINFPILQGKIKDTDWEIKNRLKNWLPKYKGLTALGGMTIRNNNNKSLTIAAKSRDVRALEEVDRLANQIRLYIPEYFLKEGVILDNVNCEVKNIHLATQDKHSESMKRQGEKYEVAFGRDAAKIFEKDKRQSKAWIDGSPFKFTAETNDKEWKKLYLTMPFNTENIVNLQLNFDSKLNALTENIALFAEHMKSHVGAIQELKGMAKEIKKAHSQKSLRGWI